MTPEETIYRWDLDKTYLRTEFDTIGDLLRTAFEPPSRKKTVPGASALLRELRATNPKAISILSGSPEQMRRVLEAKLRLDGIEWDSFTLKPSLRNLMRGRVRFLRDQVSYKLGALLESRVNAEGPSTEVLFGDDAEADAFIYSLYADLGAGRVGTEQLMAVLERARVYPAHIPPIARAAANLPLGLVVPRIFIHLERVSSAQVFSDFGRRVCPFYNYFQPAIVLMHDGFLSAEAVLRVAADITVRHGFTADALLASFVDIARRRYVGPADGRALVEALAKEDATLAPVRRSMDDLSRGLEAELAHLSEPLDSTQMTIDYADLFSRDRARAHAAKKRAKWRRR